MKQQRGMMKGKVAQGQQEEAHPLWKHENQIVAVAAGPVVYAARCSVVFACLLAKLLLSLLAAEARSVPVPIADSIQVLLLLLLALRGSSLKRLLSGSSLYHLIWFPPLHHLHVVGIVIELSVHAVAGCVPVLEEEEEMERG